MTKKKQREKVVAEITTFHLTQMMQELSGSLSREEAIAFLNQDGRAYEMWRHMMHAGEAYVKSTLQAAPQFVAYQSAALAADRHASVGR
jgi:hypothetical protein